MESLIIFDNGSTMTAILTDTQVALIRSDIRFRSGRHINTRYMDVQGWDGDYVTINTGTVVEIRTFSDVTGN